MTERSPPPDVTASLSSLGDVDVELLQPEDEIGRFVIKGPLGRGGMGVVYVAHDPTLDREVALKVIHAGVEERDRQRLLREARAMGKVAHPNVVAVHEAGAYGHRVFIVMELCRGGTLAQWLAAGPRTRAEIVAAFLQAGRGLVAAHAAGIVHRDFKPANVLLGPDGHVRVSDFGLAAPGGEVHEGGAASGGARAALMTASVGGAGTPRYMAPEQHRPGPVGPEADQFAFAVSLHEALSGRVPFAPAPTATLAGAPLGDGPPALDDDLPGWLRRVLRRALEREPARRYPSMAALLADLARGPFLSGRRLVAAGGALIVLAAAGALVVATRRSDPCAGAEQLLGGVWDAAVKARVQAAFGDEELFGRVAGRLDGYAAAWVRARTETCAATAVRHEQSEALLDARMACLDARLGTLRALTGVVAQPENAVASALPAALRLPEIGDCSEASALASWERPPPAAARAEVALVRQGLEQAKVFYQLGKPKPARQAAVGLVADARRIGWPPLVAEALYTAGYLDQQLDVAAAETELGEALAVAADARDDLLGARAQALRLWIVGVKQGRRAEALALAPVAAAAVRRAGGRDAEWGELLKNVGWVLLNDGRYVEAQALLAQAHHHIERAYGAESLPAARVLVTLTAACSERGRLDEAQRLAGRALAIVEKGLGPSSLDLGPLLNELGGIELRRGDPAAARGHYQRALAICERSLGPKSREVEVILSNLGEAAAELGERDEARGRFERARGIGLELAGADDELTALVGMRLGDLLLAGGAPAEARPLIEEGRRAVEKAAGADDLDTAVALTIHAHLLVADKAAARAVPLLERALAIVEKAAGGDQPAVGQALLELGEGYVAAARPGDAVRVLDRALPLLVARPDRAQRARAALASARSAAR